MPAEARKSAMLAQPGRRVSGLCDRAVSEMCGKMGRGTERAERRKRRRGGARKSNLHPTTRTNWTPLASELVGGCGTAARRVVRGAGRRAQLRHGPAVRPEGRHTVPSEDACTPINAEKLGCLDDVGGQLEHCRTRVMSTCAWRAPIGGDAALRWESRTNEPATVSKAPDVEGRMGTGLVR